MKAIILLFFSFVFFNLQAQQVKPIYFKGDKITVDVNQATSYAIYGKLSNEELWVIKRYDLWDRLMLTGSYKDDQLTIPHGKFSFYADIETFNQEKADNFKIKGVTRFKSQEGEYVNGKESGKWFLFFPDGNILNEQNFVNGKLHGEVKTFDKYGRLLISGNYVDGKMDGEWFYDKGKQRVVYENGVLKLSEYVKKPKKVNATVKKTNQ